MRHQKGLIWVQMVTVHWFLLWKGVICGQLPGYSIRMNSVVTVQEGLCVTIPCKFTADNRTTFTNSIGMWRNSNGTYVAYSNKSQTKGTKPNFHVVGNPDNGDCTLTITDARKGDSGSYHFRFEESETSKIKYSYTSAVTVNVTDLEDKPQITVNGRLVAGEEANLTCIPPGNCNGTPPQVQWMKSDQSGTWKSSSFVTFIPSKSDHQTTVTCKVTFQTGKSVTSKSKSLNVLSCRCMDNQIIIGIVTGNIFILLLFGLGVFCFIKRHVENKHRTESNDFQLHGAKGTESVYQDLNRPSDSTYHSIQSAKQLIHHK